MSILEHYLPPIERRVVRQRSAAVACFIDVETTGLSPQTEEIVELAIVLFAFDPLDRSILGIVDQYSGLREPSKPIPPDAIRVHGITDAVVRGQRLDFVKATDLMHQAEFLVAHNAPFDRGFVTRLFPIAESKPWMCSMRDVDWYGRGYTSRGLQALVSAHGIKVAQAHRGEADVRAALALLTRKSGSGATYFAELLHKYTERHGKSPGRSPA